MDDVAPALLQLVQDSYQEGISQSEILAAVIEKIQNGSATYEDANKYADELGDILAKSYGNITEEMLPDGKMYYNIAQRIVNPTLQQGYTDIADISEAVQELLNADAGIGITAIRPSMDQDRVKGIIDQVAVNDDFQSTIIFLKAASKNFIQHHVDESVRQNAEFQSNAGMSPKIVRKPAWKCCEWCSRLAGTYSYPDGVPQDIYRRHKNCNCTVEYFPRNGKVQNVHTKKWHDETEEDELLIRQKIGLYLEKKKWLTNQIEDVTQQYIEQSKAGIGNIILEDNVLDEDTETGKWLIDKFGGNVKILKAVKDWKMPDSVWNGMYWEYKNCSSECSIDSRLKKAVKQLNETLERTGKTGNRTGIVLNISGRTMSQDEAVSIIARILEKRGKGPTDVIIRENDDIVKVIRYK